MPDPTEYDEQQDRDQAERDAAQDQAATDAANAQRDRDAAQDAVDQRAAEADAERDKAQAAQAKRLDDLDSFVITPAEDPAPQAADNKQRLRLHVPSLGSKTTLSLGAQAKVGATRPEDWGANYDGFGAVTEGHIFLDAMGSASTATLQASNDAIVQAGKTLQLGGQEALTAASKGGVLMAGGGGVTIIGGAPNAWTGNRTSDGTTPGSAPWMSGIQTASGYIAGLAATVDATMAIFGAKQAIADAKLNNEPMPWKAANRTAQLAFLGGAFGGIVSGLGTLATLNGAANSLNLWGASWPQDVAALMGGTVVHGTGGLILSSTVTAGFYSLMGTTIATPLGLSLQGGYTEVTARKDLSLQATQGKMGISAGEEVDVTSGAGLNLMSRSGVAALVGKSVRIGDPAGSASQKPTDSVVLTSKSASILGSAAETWLLGANTTIGGWETLGLASPEVSIDGNTAVALNGDKVAINANKRFTACCEGAGIILHKSGVALGHFGTESVTTVKGELKAVKSELDGLLKRAPRGKGGAIRWSGTLIDGVAVPNFGGKVKKEFARVQKDFNTLAAKVAKLKKEKNCIAFTKSGITITHQGTVMKLNSSKTKIAGALCVTT